jgi:hypothetical protein
MKTIGFKPGNGMKKLMSDRFYNCGYVYRDGVVFKERRACKSGKQRFEKEFVHIFASDIPIYVPHPCDVKFVGRLVFHNPTLLIDGIKEIRIYFQNSSDNTKARGITLDTVTLITQSGLQIHENIYDFISSDIKIQNDSKQSIMSWDDWEAIWHTEKPVKEEEIALPA